MRVVFCKGARNAAQDFEGDGIFLAESLGCGEGIGEEGFSSRHGRVELDAMEELQARHGLVVDEIVVKIKKLGGVGDVVLGALAGLRFDEPRLAVKRWHGAGGSAEEVGDAENRFRRAGTALDDADAVAVQRQHRSVFVLVRGEVGGERCWSEACELDASNVFGTGEKRFFFFLICGC